jgi:hypothetical protein
MNVTTIPMKKGCQDVEESIEVIMRVIRTKAKLFLKIGLRILKIKNWVGRSEKNSKKKF